MSASPQTSGTGAFCFLPYRKKPSPAELNSKPQSSNDVLNPVSQWPNVEVQRHGRSEQWPAAPRASQWQYYAQLRHPYAKTSW